MIIGYIDDNNLNIEIKDSDSYEDIKMKIRYIFRAWEHLLETSGGSLSPSKCFVFIKKATCQEYNRKWNNERTLVSDLPYHTNVQGTKTYIKEIDNNKGIRYLGIRLCLSGNMQEEFLHRKERAKKYG